MTQKSIPSIEIQDGRVRASITLKSPEMPESGSLYFVLNADPAVIEDNRNAFSKGRVPLSRWILPVQQHTGHIERVYAGQAPKGAFDRESGIAACDGLYTTDPDVLVGVFCADCVGMVLLDPTIPLAAAVHSGWKGTANAVLMNLLRQLHEEKLLHPHTLQVYFSPSLLKNSLEVGPEVIEAIRAMAKKEHLGIEDCIENGEGDRFFLDNQGVNRHMARFFGIPDANIHLSDLDTLTNPGLCFSYRSTKPLDGEHFCCVWIEPENENQSETERSKR